jgi:hypothetical protein
LDSASERSYQRCFCQMLTGHGLRIVHNTQHTPLEFGKDVTAVSPEASSLATVGVAGQVDNALDQALAH